MANTTVFDIIVERTNTLVLYIVNKNVTAILRP